MANWHVCIRCVLHVSKGLRPKRQSIILTPGTYHHDLPVLESTDRRDEKYVYRVYYLTLDQVETSADQTDRTISEYNRAQTRAHRCYAYTHAQAHVGYYNYTA